MDNGEKHIYLIISQTGTLLSRILKLFTGAEYNHISLGLKRELDCMYSFGRLNPYNPLRGGFVKESPNNGTFKRFCNTRVIVLDLKIEAEKYGLICGRVGEMSNLSTEYHYNYVGLLFAAFKRVHKSRNRYYCSEFVKYMLQSHNVKGSEILPEIAQPIHFLNIPEARLIYCGRLRDYSTYGPTFEYSC